MANSLQNESSPYLQQHINNPVHWMPWGKEALRKAKDENKLIIVSIGYSACHWCHVMERESFENEAIAETMNKFYVSVKVDREERPDIDQVYMIAVQLMTNAGGWPLNCICLPDGRPIYGGTYFKPHDWQNVLLQIAKMWEETPEVAIDYAEKLTKGIQQAERLPIAEIPQEYTADHLQAIVAPWQAQFDTEDGGYNRAPKFPLPNNWLFFLRYGFLSNQPKILDQVHFTLEKIANGGIYDQVGGGFSRYSVDHRWHIPHFEKMLYDNGQLLSLYSEAYQQKPNPLYKRIVEETIAWAEREMLDANGGFYAALDADSEGVEGKFYMFDERELEAVLGEDAELFKSYFNTTPSGNWADEGSNVFYCQMDADAMAMEAGYTAEEWASLLREAKAKLLDYRAKRVRPGLDNKQLTAWNALMLKGLLDAHRVFGEAKYLERALGIATFIEQDCYADGKLLHQPADENRAIPGFLDDFAFTIEAFMSLYEATFDAAWLHKAKQLADEAVTNFFDEEKQTFYYTAAHAEELIARKSEIMDNVIPSSSSTMVRALYRLGEIYESNYLDIADQVFANVFPHIKQYGSAYSNWAIQLLAHVYGNNSITLTGDHIHAWRKQLDKHYIPNKLIIEGTISELPLLKNMTGLDSKAYLCRHKTCSPPLDSVDEIIELLSKNGGHAPIN